MRKIKLLSLLAAMVCATSMWAGTFTVNASAVPAGGGKVYVSAESPASLDNCTSATSTASHKHSGDGTCTMYAYAKANDDFRFLGWKETNSAEAAIVSTEAEGYVRTQYLQGNNKYTLNLFAFFERYASRFADDQEDEAINALLTEADGKVMEEVTITRPVYRNTFYNTICLPFSLSALEIAASSLAGAEIKTFTGAEVVGDELRIDISPVSTIEAGKPYFIKYSNADPLNQLDFENVTIDASAPEAVTFNGVSMQGTYTSFAMTAQSDLDYTGGYVFLGQNNQLYWPDVDGAIKPFRAYFYVNTSGSSSAPKRRGMPAVLNEKDETTDITNVQGDKVQSTKVLRDGQLIIIRGDKEYNTNGQIIK